MIEVLLKPADEIDIHDIQRLIELEVPEGEQVEFEKTLLPRGSEGDPCVLFQFEIEPIGPHCPAFTDMSATFFPPFSVGG